MSPAHLEALERVKGSALTEEQIAVITPMLADENNRQDVQIAAALSVGRVRVVSKEIGIGTILAALAPHGGEFLDTLVEVGEADRNVFWAMELIKQGRLDIGMEKTRGMVQTLAAEFPQMADGATALLALAEEPDPFSLAVVSKALNDADGRMTL